MPAIPVAIIQRTHGIVLIATLEAMCLWAILCMQTFIYFVNYQKDKLLLKLMVVWVWLVSTSEAMMLVVSLYQAVILHFGDYADLARVKPLVIFLLLPTCLVSLTVQSFFIYRIWRFNQQRIIIPIILAMGMCYQFAGNIYTIYMGNTVKTLQELFDTDNIMLGYYAVAAGVDVAISAFMIWLLLQHKGDSFSHTGRMLHRLIVISINSGLWTAVFAIGVLVLSVVYKNQLHYSIFYYPLAQLYANSLLANLTARNFVKAGDRQFGSTTPSGINIFNITTSTGSRTKPPQVEISSETLRQSDNNYALSGLSSNKSTERKRDISFSDHV